MRRTFNSLLGAAALLATTSSPAVQANPASYKVGYRREGPSVVPSYGGGSSMHHARYTKRPLNRAKRGARKALYNTSRKASRAQARK